MKKIWILLMCLLMLVLSGCGTEKMIRSVMPWKQNRPVLTRP